MPSNKKIFDKLVSRVKIYLVIIAVLLTIICISNINLVLPAILFYILVVGYAYWSSEKRKEELSEHIEHLTFSVDKAAKGTLINSPFPLIILETNGNTIWKNEKFSKEFINIDINNYLDSILKELKQSLENGEFVKNKNINQSIVIGSKTYKLLGEYIELRNKQSIFTLYFMDNTELIKTEEKYINSQNCIGIIMIDNYEELMQRVENEDRSTFIAQIEKNIYEWATHFEGLVIKSERDTFVLIFEQKYLSEIENKKFNILDEIKELEWTNKAQFTLSIAVSNEGSSNYEKYKSAQAGLDIVLGRGGDQAVVRENGKYVFFGGRAQEVEKRTKVKARTVAHALKELILEAENVMVMGHSNSDMDCIGSSMGIYRLARSLGKNAYIVNNSYGIGLENFMEKAKVVKEKTGQPILTSQAGSPDLVMEMLQSCGESLFNEDGSVNIVDNKALKPILEIYSQMVKDGTLVEVTDWDQYIASINNGTTAGVINGCWIMASITANDDQSGKWALTNMPKLDGIDGATNYSNNGGSSWAISSNCKKTDLAIDFMKSTFAGSTALYDDIIAKGALATWAPAGDSEAYAQPVAFFSDDPVYAKIVDFATKTPSNITGAFYYDARDAVGTALSNIIQTGADMDSELQTAQETVEFNMGN